MTDDRARKKAVRRRMEQTGEKYTEARRALENAPRDPETERAHDEDPTRRGHFGRFTEGARRVVVLALEEARTSKHDFVGSDHLLLGLLREQEGIAARVLGSLGVTFERVQATVVRSAGLADAVASRQLEFAPGAKQALELALREALRLGDDHIGTEHILLGLALDREGVAAGILLDFDADSETLRSKVTGILSGTGYRSPSAPGSPGEVSGLLERFSEHARDVIDWARREARALGHDHIGDEQILLGLLRERDGHAGRALEALGVTLEQARARVLERVPGGKPALTGQRPLTPRTKGIVERALREALEHGHTHIDTEHILLGLVRETESTAHAVLLELDADPGKIRTEIIKRLPRTG